MGLTQSTITCMVQDKQGYLWIGTEYGLNRFDGLSYRHFGLDRDENKAANEIRSLLYDGRTNNLWIGSYGGGISKLNLDDFEFTDYTSAEISLRDIMF